MELHGNRRIQADAVRRHKAVHAKQLHPCVIRIPKRLTESWMGPLIGLKKLCLLHLDHEQHACAEPGLLCAA